MQSRHSIWRSACKAGNAYNPILALRSAFGSSARCLDEHDYTPSISETSRIAPRRVISSGIARPGSTGAEQSSAIWRADTRGNQHDPKQEPVSSKNGTQELATRRSGKIANAHLPPKFTSHLSWKRHMAKIREESPRVQHTRWRPDNESHLSQMKSFMDYAPMVVQPEPSRLNPPLPTPWTSTNEYAGRSHTVNYCLTSDINRFAEYIRPTIAEQRARSAVVEETLEFIRTALDPATTGAELFGSEKSGIALPFSDIDIRLYDVKFSDASHSRLFPRLQRLQKAMFDSDKFMLATIRNATHPILNCHHRESGIDVQIVAGDSSFSQQEVVKKYVRQIPQLREVYYVVRTVLSMRGLVDVYSGGMGSYGTFVMVLAILLRRTKTMKSGNEVTSGSQLIAFLDSFCNLDTHRYGLAAHPRTLFKKHEPSADMLKEFSALAAKRGDPIRAGQWVLCAKRRFQPYLLCLQDPANPMNDLGKKSHAIKHIHATLAYLRQSLLGRCLALKQYKSSRANGQREPEPLLLPLVGRCHEVYYERRSKLEAFGKRLEAEHPTTRMNIHQVAS